MTGDSSKRRSLLFPFRSQKQEPAKFEVMNRKKSPLAQQTSAMRAVNPPVSSVKPVTTALKPPPVSAPLHPQRSTSPLHHPLHLFEHRSLSPQKTQPQPEDKYDSGFAMGDMARSANLSVSVALPPVPDYNSKSFAPPVTIQGRTVSLAKKDPPPRRKPPTLTNLNEKEQSQPKNKSSMLSSQDSLNTVDTGLDAMSHPSIEIANEGCKNAITMSGSGKEPITTMELAIIKTSQHDAPPIVVSASDDTIPKTVPQNNTVTTLEKRPQDSESLSPFAQQLTEQTDHEVDTTADSDFSFVKESDGIEQHPHIAPLDYEDSIVRGALSPPVISPSLTQVQSAGSGYDAEFFDAEEHSTRSNVDLDKTTPALQGLTLQVQADDEEKRQESDFESDASSVKVKPLRFHKKTPSSASTMTNSVPDYSVLSTRGMTTTTGTHKKQLSLSDEIMRDIENFQPGGIHYVPMVDSDHEEVSPVTPLNNLNGIGETVELVPTPLALEDDDEDEDFGASRRFVSDGILDKGQRERKGWDSLFHDSSDDELKRLSDREQGVVEQEDGDYSLSSSVAPEIDYRGSPIENAEHSRLGLESDEYSSDEEVGPAPSYRPSIPRSSSITDLHERTSSDQFSPDVGSSYSPVSPSIPGDLYAVENDVDSCSPGSKDMDSVYAYQSPERTTFRVMNDDDDVTTPQMRSPTQEAPRRFHVVNDGNYSESDSDSFDACAREDINNDYSVVRQENYLKTQRSSVASSEALSFTAKSPKDSYFEIDSNPKDALAMPLLNGDASDASLSLVSSTGPPSISTPQQSILTPHEVPSPMLSEFEPLAAANVYDRRANDVVAPVAYISQGMSKPRRPPPPDVPTRSGRSASISQPKNMYNSVKEDLEVPQVHQHEPQKSNYVELLRLGAGTTNTNARASEWGLPIGISKNDYTKATSSWRVSYKKPTRSSKNDLKHGRVKQRQLALEVGDDEEDDQSLGTGGRDSVELKRLDTATSTSASTSASVGVGLRTSSPSQSTTSFSPKREPTPQSITRTGTLKTDRVLSVPQVSVGRSGTVVRDGDKGHMTLYIANPDIEEESE